MERRSAGHPVKKMNERTIETRMAKIFTDEEKRRVSVDCSGQSACLSVDVHGMDRFECMKYIRNLLALLRDPFQVRIVHGYNHGTALRDLVRNGGMLSPKVTSVSWDTRNDGVTQLSVRGLCPLQ